MKEGGSWLLGDNTSLPAGSSEGHMVCPECAGGHWPVSPAPSSHNPSPRSAEGGVQPAGSTLLLSQTLSSQGMDGSSSTGTPRLLARSELAEAGAYSGFIVLPGGGYPSAEMGPLLLSAHGAGAGPACVPMER